MEQTEIASMTEGRESREREVRPKPAIRGHGRGRWTIQEVPADHDQDSRAMTVSAIAMRSLPHRSQKVPRLHTTYIAPAV